MSYLLDMLGKGLDGSLTDRLGHYFCTAGLVSLSELAARTQAEPGRADLQVRLGVAYLDAAQASEAIEHLQLACRHDPRHVPARLALACALEETGRTPDALEELERADGLQPNQPVVLFCIGFLLEKMSRPEQAAATYRRAIELDSDLVFARQRLAAVAVLRNELSEAIEQYAWLVQHDPGDTHARATLGQLHYRAGQPAEAVRHFEDSIAMEPENWALADEQVEALVAAGQIPEAVERLEEMLQTQGDLPDLHLRLADLYDRLDQDEPASTHYRAALDLQPNYLEGLVRFGTHHLMHGRWADASEAFAGAVDLNDRLLTAYVGLGVAQAAQRDEAGALSSFDLAAALEPNSSLLMREMARLQLRSALDCFAAGAAEPPCNLDPRSAASLEGHELLALQLERHAEHVRQEPHYADVRYRYGVLLRAEGLLREALEQFDAAIALNPAYTQAIIKKAITLKELDRDEEAVAAFRAALELKPQHVELHYRLALLYTDGRQFEEAVRQVEAASADAGPQTRARLALALQQIGLLDRAAATWRSLRRTFQTTGAARG